MLLHLFLLDDLHAAFDLHTVDGASDMHLFLHLVGHLPFEFHVDLFSIRTLFSIG